VPERKWTTCGWKSRSCNWKTQSGMNRRKCIADMNDFLREQTDRIGGFDRKLVRRLVEKVTVSRTSMPELLSGVTACLRWTQGPWFLTSNHWDSRKGSIMRALAPLLYPIAGGCSP
jgi:hypothetical protein